MSYLFPDIHWRDVFGLLKKSTLLSDNELALPWLRNGYTAYWFARSSRSLEVIVRWRQTFSDQQQLNVWVPDYFCNQSLYGVRSSGARIVFYPITETMSPNWQCCKVLACETSPHIFLLPHYFGKSADLLGAQNFCRQHRSVFVEDCAHVILPTGLIGSTGDFVIYSQHKVVAVPDGALL